MKKIINIILLLTITMLPTNAVMGGSKGCHAVKCPRCVYLNKRDYKKHNFLYCNGCYATRQYEHELNINGILYRCPHGHIMKVDTNDKLFIKNTKGVFEDFNDYCKK